MDVIHVRRVSGGESAIRIWGTQKIDQEQEDKDAGIFHVGRLLYILRSSIQRLASSRYCNVSGKLNESGENESRRSLSYHHVQINLQILSFMINL